MAMPVGVGAFAKDLFVLLRRPLRVVELVGGIEVFVTGQKNHGPNVRILLLLFYMGRLILVSATALEIAPAITYLEQFKSPKPYSYILGNLEVDVCITGVGMVNTAFELGRQSLKDYHFALNAGVC